MSDDGFEPLSGGVSHLTALERASLTKYVIRRAHDERSRAIYQMVAGIFGLIRKVWRRIHIRQEARAALGSMTDRELRDIGLSRSGIEAAINYDDTDAKILRLETPAMHASQNTDRSVVEGARCLTC
jgi:uncharacterized protein YjiS (DUF1127 family)